MRPSFILYNLWNESRCVCFFFVAAVATWLAEIACRIHVRVVELLLQLRLCEVYWIVFTEVDDMFCLVAFVAILWSNILFSSILQRVRTLTVKLTDAVMEWMFTSLAVSIRHSISWVSHTYVSRASETELVTKRFRVYRQGYSKQKRRVSSVMNSLISDMLGDRFTMTISVRFCWMTAITTPSSEMPANRTSTYGWIRLDQIHFKGTVGQRDGSSNN
jgi:hypothetical protein